MRPQPVCTSSVIHRMPCRSSTSLEGGEQPVGRQVKPPTPWTGSAISAATGPPAWPSRSSRSATQAAMNSASVRCAYGPRVRTPPCTYSVCSGDRLVGDQAGVAGDADRAEGAAVVAVAQRQDLVGAAVGGGEQQRGVVGLGARGGEEDPGVGDAGQLGDPLGQLDRRLAEVERRGVQDPPGLLGDRRGDLGQRVRGHGGEDAAEEVQVAVALGVPDVPALAVRQLDRLARSRWPASRAVRRGGGRAGRRGRSTVGWWPSAQASVRSP